MLAELGEDAGVLAGGQSLVPMLNLRLARPSALVDVGRVAALSGISANGALRLGATTRQADALRSAVVAERAPLLAEALRHVGHPATRSRGTVGGSIAHADPAAELPAVLLALDGEAIVASAGGERAIPAASLFLGPFATALAEGELLTALRLPATRPTVPASGSPRSRAAAATSRWPAPPSSSRRATRASRSSPSLRAPSAPRRRSARWRRAPAPRRRRQLAAAAAEPVGRSARDRRLPARGRACRDAARPARGGGRAWLTSAPCACA